MIFYALFFLSKIATGSVLFNFWSSNVDTKLTITHSML